jgi:hypothetical protein
MAGDCLALMRGLGHDQFCVAGRARMMKADHFG